MIEEAICQKETEQQVSQEETAELESATEWKLRPQEMEKIIARGIELIYPLIRRKCSREDCIRRASHWSSWTE
jgi:hypothetical protein